MNARPDFVNLETGEIVDVMSDGGRTPFDIAKSQLAGFKFRLIETVAADPLLRKAPCTDAITVFMHFVTIDEKTLQPTAAYASIITLMSRGGMKTTAAKMARKLLEKHGYLVPTGSKTKDGCVKYRLENPREEIVQMHVREAAEYWKERAAEERKEERRKKASETTNTDVGSKYDPTQTERGVATQPDVGSKYDPNYLRTYLGDSGSEEENRPLRTSSVPEGMSPVDDGLPFDVPETEDEAAAMLEKMIGDKLTAADPAAAVKMMRILRGRLMDGNLSPRDITDLLRAVA